MILVITAIIVLVLTLVYSKITLTLTDNKLNVKGPAVLPIFGNGLLFLGDTHDYVDVFGKIIKKYGGASRVFIFDKLLTIFTDPATVEAVVLDPAYNDKADQYNFLLPWLGSGLVTANGQIWKSHRKLITPTLHFNILQSFLPIFEKNQKVLRKNFAAIANGEDVDIFPLILLNALDNVSESAMGVSVGAQENKDSEYVQAVKSITSLTMQRIYNPLLGNDFIFSMLPVKSEYDRVLKILHDKTQTVISERREKLSKSNVTFQSYTESGTKMKFAFLDMLLLSELDGQKMDDQSIREEVDTFMFAGHDTTSAAVSFSLYCISQNKGVAEKIIEEQKQIMGAEYKTREPTYQEYSQMKYLDMVIKEVLRLYPSVPMIGRAIRKDTVINGMFHPANSSISVSIYHMHRDPKYFEDPEEFRPERFSDQVPHAWIPFSAGPRNCIGQKFAMLQMKVALSGIVKNFELLPSNIVPKVCFDLALGSKNGVHLRLLPRK